MPEDPREAVYDKHLAALASRGEVQDLSASRLIVELLLTCDILNQVSARQLAKAGLSRATFNVLALLRQGGPEGMQLHKLGELLLVSRANITGLINHLEERGLVVRVVPSGDRRVRQARITPRGTATIQELLPQHASRMAILLAGMSERDKQQIRSGLRKLRVSVYEHEDEAFQNAHVPARRKHLDRRVERGAGGNGRSAKEAEEK